LISTIDTVITAETPEGIAISMRAAGFPVRCTAFLIDALIRYLIVSGVAATLGSGGRVGTGLLLIIVFIILWLYPVIFELMPAAATPGKRAMGIQVMMANGLPLTPAGCLIRNLMRAVDMLPLLYGFAIISVLMRQDARRLGDLAAGTIVVYRDQASPTGDFGPGEPLPPPMPLTTRQQTAIAAFGRRRRAGRQGVSDDGSFGWDRTLAARSAALHPAGPGGADVTPFDFQAANQASWKELESVL
jgi:uncharacterized RDD family membrane protein YckC